MSLAAFGLVSCASTPVVRRTNVEEQIDLSGNWNDTDSRLVSREMIKDALSRPWLDEFVMKTQKKPRIIVGAVLNKSHEHINTETFVKDLEREVIEGRFREDLYYRLNVINIRIPPLRKRKEDIPLLAKHFMAKYSALMNKDIRQISDYALELLMNYHFPGNVRELENIIERSVALETSSIILPESLTLSSFKMQTHKKVETEDTQTDVSIPPDGIDLQARIDRMERAYLEKALIACSFQLALVAELDGISQSKVNEIKA